jgi:hypothetical protein
MVNRPGIPGIGIPYPSYNPLSFLVDDEIREVEIDTRWDLTAEGAQAVPTVATGIFIVHEHTVPSNTGEVVFGIHPHCWRRENPGAVGAGGEFVRQLDPTDVAGSVLFDATKDGNQPLLVETDYNLPAIAGSGQNTSRQRLRGSTWLPRDGAQFRDVVLQNPLRTYWLPAGSVFRVLFRLMPNAAGAAALPDPWIIPDYTPGPVATQHRIDFAGALVLALRMPQTLYEKLKVARRLGLLGPEAAGIDPSRL